MFIAVTTDMGHAGYGEGGCWGQINIEHFASYLVGKSAFTIEHHWNVMHRFSFFQGTWSTLPYRPSILRCGTSRAKSLEYRVYELLGGSCRTKARVYAHIYEKNIEAVLAE